MTGRFKPSLESLDGRIVPRAGGFGPPPFADGQSSSTTDTSQTATRFAVQVQRATYAGAEATVTVIALDASGRPVRDYAGTVTLTSSDAAATLPAAYTFTAADRGRHTFTVTLGTTGSQTVTATDGASLTGAGKVSVTAAPVATKLFVTTERDVYTGAAARVVVVALDASNRPVPTYTGTVTLTSTDAGAALPATYTFTASDRGVKVFELTPSAAGSQTVTATDGAGLTGTVSVSVQAAPVATQLVVRVIPGQDGTSKVLVAAVDDAGRPVSTYTGTVTLTSSDAAATLPAAYTFTASDRGVKVFDVTLPTTGSQTVSAGDGTLSGSASLNVGSTTDLPPHAGHHRRRR